jgi:uncharacterized protein (TIGR02145 family)
MKARFKGYSNRRAIMVSQIVLFVLFVYMLFHLSACKKDNTTNSNTLIFDSIVDIEGNVYKTVKIGDQWWMAENLKCRKFRNGVEIRKVQDELAWANAKSAYCIYEDRETKTGFLYNYWAITDSNNLAPEGWHIPTESEWQTLEKHLGMSDKQVDSISWRGTNEGDELKALGYSGWTKYKDVWPTNSSGFNALAGSCRLPDGRFGYPGLFYTGFWWTSTTQNDSVYYRHLDHKNSNIFKFKASKQYGMSIRCIKDN